MGGGRGGLLGRRSCADSHPLQAQNVSFLGNKKVLTACARRAASKGRIFPSSRLDIPALFCLTACVTGPQAGPHFLYVRPYSRKGGIFLLLHKMGWAQPHCPHVVECGLDLCTLPSHAMNKCWACEPPEICFEGKQKTLPT